MTWLEHLNPGACFALLVGAGMWAAVIYGFIRLATDDKAYQHWCDDMDRPKNGDW